MKKSAKFLIATVLLVIISVITCPSAEDFKIWISQKAQTQQEGLLSKAVAGGLSLQAKLMMDYSNYHLFAIVKTRELDSQVTYIGLFGIWIKAS